MEPRRPFLRAQNMAGPLPFSLTAVGGRRRKRSSFGGPFGERARAGRREGGGELAAAVTIETPRMVSRKTRTLMLRCQPQEAQRQEQHWLCPRTVEGGSWRRGAVHDPLSPPGRGGVERLCSELGPDKGPESRQSSSWDEQGGEPPQPNISHAEQRATPSLSPLLTGLQPPPRRAARTKARRQATGFGAGAHQGHPA